MALDRWIALILLALFCAYGYSAWFTMDELLPPILRSNPVWPSSFPKALAVIGTCLALAVALNLEKPVKANTDNSSGSRASPSELDYRNLRNYKTSQAVILIVAMLAYAILLRPLGFLLATTLFLFTTSIVLGERRFLILALLAPVTAIGVWYLIDSLLGIFLRPFPSFLQKILEAI